MASAKRRVAVRVSSVKSSGEDKGYETGKFTVGEGAGWHVKIRYPSRRQRSAIYKVLDKYPPGSSLRMVSKDLAKVGAAFAPWADGKPGDNGAYK